MAVLQLHKVIASLPSTLAPNAMYAVRAGAGVDVYFTDMTGQVAHRINTGTGTGGSGGFERLVIVPTMAELEAFPAAPTDLVLWMDGVSHNKTPAEGAVPVPVPVPPPPQPLPFVDSVVVIGASLMNSMFGKDLSMPHAGATNMLRNLGHDLPVYGYATGGGRVALAEEHYSLARAAHPNAMIIMHFGGNDVSAGRPFPGARDAMETGLANLLAVAKDDARFFPASISFRDYDDNTFQNPSLGSKPYNEQVLIPWIVWNFPHAMAPYGRPKLDFYRRVLMDFEAWLHTDNVHLTTAGYAEFRGWIVARMAELLREEVPVELPERVYTPPDPNAGAPVFNTVIVNFNRDLYPTFANNFSFLTQRAQQGNMLKDIDGAITPIGISAYVTTGAVNGVTDPGYGGANTGNVLNMPTTGAALLHADVTKENWFVTANVVGYVDITGLTPGATYELGFVGSRGAGDVRTTEVTVDGKTTNWNTSLATPVEKKLTVTASPQGTLALSFKPINGSAYAYLGGFSVRKVI